MSSLFEMVQKVVKWKRKRVLQMLTLCKLTLNYHMHVVKIDWSKTIQSLNHDIIFCKSN